MEVKVGQNIYAIMEPQPLRSVPPSGSGEEGGGGGSGSSGAHMRGEEEPMVVTEGKKIILNEESPLIKVDFGNCAQNLLDKNGNSVLTPAQYFEFQRQSLIFEHMKAGLPVPLHLWSPIWKKVASSDRGGIYKQYSSFVGSGPPNVDDRKKCRRTDGNNWKVDQRYMMDPEPGRCRRTDGNKWRCKRDAVPDQKYCERHMHRGSQRSRKHVELFQIANPWDTTSPKDLENLKTISTHSQNNPLPQSPLPLTFLPPSDSKNSKTNPTLSQLINPSSSNTSNIPNSKDGNKIDSTFLGERKGYTLVGDGINSSITTNAANNATLAVTISTPIMPNTAANNSNNDVIDFVNSATGPISSSNPTTHSIPGSGCSFTTTNTHTANINNKNNNNEGIGQKREGGSFSSLKNMIIGSSTSGNNAIVGNSVSTGFRFSPKSVLQVLGCRGSCSYRSDIELELGRCRRTDGKKWRCSRVVVPDQKYCEKHMHRGAKKRLEVLHPVANLTTVPASPCTPCTMSTTRKADSAATSTSTNLSMSIPTGPQFLTNDVKSPSSCSSDATINDTAITTNENSNFSS